MKMMSKNVINDASEERTPLIRGGRTNASRRHVSAAVSSTSRPSSMPVRGQRRRSAGEVFTLDDDQRVLHRPKICLEENALEHAELHRDYSRFLLYGGDQKQHSRKNSTTSGSSGGGDGGGESRHGAHRRQWSVSTEPTRNMALPKPATLATAGGIQIVKDQRDRVTSSRNMCQEEEIVQSEKQTDQNEIASKKGQEKLRLDHDYRYFYDYDRLKQIAVIVSYTVLAAYTALVLLGPPFVLPADKSEWCPEYESIRFGTSSAPNDDDTVYEEPHYENPDYITDPCFHRRLPQLLGLTLEECDLSRRMLASVIFGGAIGYERRASDRPAGIRTMGLVSLGSCFFTISSQLAFKSSTMGWDASRVTAAIPTGVGFLGAGLIWKGTVGVGPSEIHQVHGLTTAASLWLSAATGAGAGGALYFVAGYSVMLVIIILRYGPKLYFQEDASYNDDNEEDFSNNDDNELISLNTFEEVDDVRNAETTKPELKGPGRLCPEWKTPANQCNDRSCNTYAGSTGNRADASFEGDESCPSFVSFTDLHAEATEEGKLRTSTPPPYGSVEPGSSERHSILKTPRTTGSTKSSKVQIMIEEIPHLPFGRVRSETARSVASNSAKNRTSKAHTRNKDKKETSKRPPFHS